MQDGIKTTVSTEIESFCVMCAKVAAAATVKKKKKRVLSNHTVFTTWLEEVKTDAELFFLFFLEFAYLSMKFRAKTNCLTFNRSMTEHINDDFL